MPRTTAGRMATIRCTRDTNGHRIRVRIHRLHHTAITRGGAPHICHWSEFDIRRHGAETSCREAKVFFIIEFNHSMHYCGAVNNSFNKSLKS